MGVEVGTDAEHDPGSAGRGVGRTQQRSYELIPFAGVLTQSEDLFELVDDEQKIDILIPVNQRLTHMQVQASRAVQEFCVHRCGRVAAQRGEVHGAFLQRTLTWCHQHNRPLIAHIDGGSLYRSDQPRSQDGGLSGTRRAEYCQKPPRLDPIYQMRDQRFTAKETITALGLERR
jgi:hypothetical protein